MNTGWQPQIVLDEADARFASINDMCDARALSPPSQTRPDPLADWIREAYMLQLVGLARIVNSTLLESKSLSLDNKKFDFEDWEMRYRTWYSALPAEFAMNEGASAHVVVMHMWFQGSLIQSFRPVFHHGSQETGMAYRICQEAADTISALLNHYRELYGLRGFNGIQCRALLDAYTIHLQHFPASFPSLRAILDVYEELCTHQEWAKAWLDKVEYETRHSTAAAAEAAEVLFTSKPTPAHEDTTQVPLPDETEIKAHADSEEKAVQSGKGVQPHDFSIIQPRSTKRRLEYFFSPFTAH